LFNFLTFNFQLFQMKLAQFTLSTFTAFNFSRKINYTSAHTSTFSAVFFFRIMQYICMKAVFLAAKAMILLVLVLSSFPTLAPARTSNMMPTSGTHKVYLPQSNRPVAPSSPDRCTYIPTPAGAPGHCGLHRWTPNPHDTTACLSWKVGLKNLASFSINTWMMMAKSLVQIVLSRRYVED